MHFYLDPDLSTVANPHHFNADTDNLLICRSGSDFSTLNANPDPDPYQVMRIYDRWSAEPPNYDFNEDPDPAFAFMLIRIYSS